jgi:hypothetical protein
MLYLVLYAPEGEGGRELAFHHAVLCLRPTATCTVGNAVGNFLYCMRHVMIMAVQ